MTSSPFAGRFWLSAEPWTCCDHLLLRRPSNIEDTPRRVPRFADIQRMTMLLLAERARGASYFKIYRQFKMYNDPALNPAIYGKEAH